MEKLNIKFSTYLTAVPPQPIRMKTPEWAGDPEGTGEPWMCLPFVEGSTYGLELVYPFETECHVVNDGGAVRFDWDYAREPGGGLTGGEFGVFSPRAAAKYYLFNTKVDVQAPPGHVLRTEPHPRFFTDDTGTVPLPMIAHLQNEWYPRTLFIVLRAPRPGQCHIFRKGEPYAQLLFVPQRMHYELTPLSPTEEAARRALEKNIQFSRQSLATHRHQNCDGSELDNHYKILAAAFTRDGMAGVEAAVREAVERQQRALPSDRTIPECLALGAQLVKERKYLEAKEIYIHVVEREPNNAEALSQLGICLVCIGHVVLGIQTMQQAVALQPQVPRLHSSLGEILRLLNRFQEAEAEFRCSLQLDPSDPGILSVLGLTLAQQGRTAEGLAACRAALVGGYAVPAVHYRLGLVLAQEGHLGEARTHLENALALNPQYADARRALEELPQEV